LLQGLELPYFTREMQQALEAVSTDAHAYSNELFTKLEQQRRVACALLSLRFASVSGHSAPLEMVHAAMPVDQHAAQFVDEYMDSGAGGVTSSGGSGKKRRKIALDGVADSDTDLLVSAAAAPVRASRFSASTPSVSAAPGLEEINFDQFDGPSSPAPRGMHLSNNPFASAAVPNPSHVGGDRAHGRGGLPAAKDLPPAPSTDSRKAPLLQKLALMLNKAKKN
jgi:hypothetical protein